MVNKGEYIKFRDFQNQDVGRGGAWWRPRHWCIREDPRHEGGKVLEVLLLIFTVGFPAGSPTEKSFRFVCINLIRFPFGWANISLESSIRCPYEDIFSFLNKVVLYHKLEMRGKV